MIVYWFTLEHQPYPTPLNLGVGVTARSEQDARDLVREAIGDLKVTKIAPVNEVASLDQNHVVPNMGNIFVRGIWFPMDYDNPKH